jgi:hypothetical protein
MLVVLDEFLNSGNREFPLALRLFLFFFTKVDDCGQPLTLGVSQPMLGTAEVERGYRHEAQRRIGGEQRRPCGNRGSGCVAQLEGCRNQRGIGFDLLVCGDYNM